MRNELSHISKAVASGCPEDGQSNVKDVSKGEDEEQKRSSREAVLKLAMNFLRTMKQEKLADLLQCGEDLMCWLNNKVKCFFFLF